jgi:hypothetical protein
VFSGQKQVELCSTGQPGAAVPTCLRRGGSSPNCESGPAALCAAARTRASGPYEILERRRVSRKAAGRVGDPGSTQAPQTHAWRSRRISAESRKKPKPTLSGIMPNAAAIQASDSTRAMSANVII